MARYGPGGQPLARRLGTGRATGVVLVPAPRVLRLRRRRSDRLVWIVKRKLKIQYRLQPLTGCLTQTGSPPAPRQTHDRPYALNRSVAHAARWKAFAGMAESLRIMAVYALVL
jgi:hypothetical protein